MNIRAVLAGALALGMGGCASHIVALRPVEKVEVWVPDAAASAPATTVAADRGAATAPASSAAATQPGHVEVKVVDPNEATRFIYNATYDNVWQQALGILTEMGFTLDRKDYRLGVLTTQPLPSAQVVEFWKPQHVNVTDSLENTVNNQRRVARLTISKVPGKPDFYEIGIQVLVQRQTNPSEEIGGPVFVEGSGFGRNSITLRSDYVEPNTPPGRWVTLGHDPDLERKLMDVLFLRI